MEIDFIDDKRLDGVRVGVLKLDYTHVGPTEFSFERFEKKVFSDIREKYTDDLLKRQPYLQSFRELYWKFKMDPTKLRVASEALLKRILREHNLWRINNLIDLVNLASAETLLPISAWDADKIVQPIEVRIAKKGEEFHGIVGVPVLCKGNELVVADQQQIITLGLATADCDECKITSDTETAFIAVFATEVVTNTDLLEAMKTVKLHLENFMKGEVDREGVFHKQS